MIRGNSCSFIKGTSGGGGNLMERIGARFYILENACLHFCPAAVRFSHFLREKLR